MEGWVGEKFGIKRIPFTWSIREEVRLMIEFLLAKEDNVPEKPDATGNLVPDAVFVQVALCFSFSTRVTWEVSVS